jgi:DNA-directed RNA polymerase specialized sigma subunit, sigma24 homolog
MAADDTELLKRLLAGEQQAFRELVSTYQGAMRAVAYAIVGSRHADEAVQDAWLSVVRNIGGFESRSSLKTWLLTITANAAKNRYKQNRREVLLDDLPSPHGTIDDDRFSADGHWLLAPWPGIRTPLKPCSLKMNCVSALSTRCSASHSCKAVCWCCVSVRGWRWKRFVTFLIYPSPISGCWYIGPGLKSSRPWSISRKPVNVDLQAICCPVE